MKIDVAKQRILLLKDQVTAADAEKKAWEKKADAFDAFSKVASFLSARKTKISNSPITNTATSRSGMC